MKKKIIIGALALILILGTVAYLINKPISNEYIEYSSAEDYRIELINSIEDQDYELTSNLVYSVVNSDYYEELNQQIVDDKYNNVEVNSDAYLLYRGLVSLFEYVDVHDDSSFELIGVDINNLKDNGVVYYEYELDGVNGYYVNNTYHLNSTSKSVHDKITLYSSIDECVEYNNDQEYCEDNLYLELANDIYYDDYDKILTNIDYTLVNEDYKNPEQQTIVNYSADAQFYDLVTIVYDLDTIMDEDTPESERDELQMYLIQKANPYIDIKNLDVDDIFSYGDSKNDNELNSKDYSALGVNHDISTTYESANIDGAIDSFIEGNYFNNDGSLDMNRIVEGYNEYEDMFLEIDTDITGYKNQ